MTSIIACSGSASYDLRFCFPARFQLQNMSNNNRAVLLNQKAFQKVAQCHNTIIIVLQVSAGLVASYERDTVSFSGI